MTWQAAQALEEGPFAKKRKFDLPLREQSIIVTDHGFYPETIAVFKGERVRFFVTSTSDDKSCFILKGKNLFLAAEKGKVSEGEVLFREPQVVEYYCPTLKTKGHITVLERPKDKERRRAQRTMASEKVRVWMPREE